MKFKNEFWAFIPARSGSKTIKNKNIKKLGGIPLLAYSIKIARKIKAIKKIVFSSDSEKYIDIAAKYRCNFFHKRSKKISADNTGDLVVFQDFVINHYKIHKKFPKYFIHLTPTTPVRYKKTVEKGIKFFKSKQKKYTAMRSVNLMSETAYKSLRILNKKLCPVRIKDFNLDKYSQSRQLYQDTFEANGIVDIYKTKNILKGYLLGNKVLPFVTTDFMSDIDDINDFNYVKYFINKTKFKI